MFETRPAPRRRVAIAAAVLLAVLAIDTAIWFVACRRLDDGAREAAASSGWTLSAGASHWGGWPLVAEIALPDIVLRAGPDVIPPLAWTAPGAALRLSAWHPTVLTATAPGAQTLAIGAAPPLPFTAQSLVATIDLTGHDPVRIAAGALDVTTPDGPVAIGSADLRLVPDGLSATLTGLTLPGRTGQPIVPPIETLRIDGRISPPIQPQPTALQSARAWRASGGRLEITSATLRWGSLDATARATLTLDPDLQPDISGQITATGLGGVIEQLAQSGAMTRSAATAAQGMLAILSAPSGGGPVTLPLTVHDAVLTIARIPLLRLAPLQWD